MSLVCLCVRVRPSRRLLFLRNQQFVQTEARLLRRPAKEAKAKKKKRKAAAAANRKKEDETGEKEEETGEASVCVSPSLGGAAGALPAPPAGGAVLASTDEHGVSLRFDWSYLDDHHCAILASLALSPALDPRSALGGRASGALIGLGGGALVMCLMRYYPQLRLTVAEIDPDMIGVAKRFFGYESHANVREVVTDGAVLLREHAATARAGAVDTGGGRAASHGGALDFIVIDADSADPSLGLSAPPRELISDEAIQNMFDSLGDRGQLIVNVAARDESARIALCTRIEAVFRGGIDAAVTTESSRVDFVFTLKPSDELVNVIVIAVKGGITSSESPDSSASNNKKSKSKTVAVRRPEPATTSFVREALERIERVKAAVILTQFPVALFFLL